MPPVHELFWRRGNNGLGTIPSVYIVFSKSSGRSEIGYFEQTIAKIYEISIMLYGGGGRGD